MSPRTSNVGIVIVSHSPKVAEGAADMVRQMVGPEVPLAFCGGTLDGDLGTSVEKIMAAIDAAWSENGVAILMDLGGAETNSEMAIEFLPEERRGRVVICNAPVVEGAVIAATEAAGGSDLATVRRAAESAGGAATPERTAVAPNAAHHATLLIDNAAGLHARPATKLAKLAKSFKAKVELARSEQGPWIDAGSVLKVAGLKAARGTTLLMRGGGEESKAAMAAILALASRQFDES